MQIDLKGYCTPNQKLTCFVLVSQNYHHFFWKKNIYTYVIVIVQELKNGIEILVGQVVLSYGSKQSKYCFDQ